MKEKILSIEELRDKLGFSEKKFSYEIVDGKVKFNKRPLVNIPA